MKRSAAPRSDRDVLLEQLRREAILRASEHQPVLSRDGRAFAWMLDSLAVTLTPRGARLAGRCLLELLRRFEGRQLATYGTIGIPILQSVLALSRGRYHGLLVRKERKPYGSLKLIEGPIDPDEPVVMVDDSISSGTAMAEGCARLEEAGLRVEGGVCLVRFGWYGGFARMQERGYHMEAVYDIWDDFMRYLPGETCPPANPTKAPLEIPWAGEVAAEGLAPPELARRVMESLLAGGGCPRPPASLDRPYDAAGGAWVSVRSRADIYLRHAREGFWNFPGEPAPPAPAAVVEAAARTAARLPEGETGLQLLRGSAVAVTFFPALEDCAVGGLDNERYGIVVRSRERPGWMGGALPNMPGIAGEWEQFQHARRRNARLVSFEPFHLYRHGVEKIVEPGVAWQPTGVPSAVDAAWVDDPNGAGAAARRIRERACARLAGREDGLAPEVNAGGWPAEVDTVFVSVHLHGRVRGCMGAAVRRPDFDLDPVIDAALRDARFDPPLRPQDAPNLAVTAAFLHRPLDLGRMTSEEAAERVIPGRHALQAWGNGLSGLLLPSVAVTHNLDAAGFAREVMAKAGIEQPPCRWTRWECGAWLADGAGPRRMKGAFPAGQPPAELEERVLDLLPRLAGYLLRNQREDGSFFAWYFPFADRLHPGLDLSRTTHAAWVLTRAAAFMGDPVLARAGRRSAGYLLGLLRRDERGRGWVVRDGEDPNVAEAAFLLLTLCHFPEGDPALQHAPALVRTLRESVGRHGRIATHQDPAAGAEASQDYFPGQVLLALGTAALAGLTRPGWHRLEPAFRYYRHRFRYRRNWGQVAWHLQAWAAWWWVTRDAELAEHVFEIADWALEWQSQKHGGFLNDHQPAAPGFTTGLYLEGIAAAAGVADALGDAGRLRRYLDAGARGLAFLDGLVLQERDRPVLPNPGFASGAVRESGFRSQVRLDYVAHALSAALGFLSAAGLAPRARGLRAEGGR